MKRSQEAKGVEINKPHKTVYIIKASALRQKPCEWQCNLVILVPAFQLSSLHTQALYPIYQMRVSVTNVKWPQLESQ